MALSHHLWVVDGGDGLQRVDSCECIKPVVVDSYQQTYLPA